MDYHILPKGGLAWGWEFEYRVISLNKYANNYGRLYSEIEPNSSG